MKEETKKAVKQTLCEAVGQGLARTIPVVIMLLIFYWFILPVLMY